MRYIIDKNQRPAYLFLYRQLRDDILRGIYPQGGRLPSKRLLAEETGLSAVTVEHAYALLCDEGYAQARERSGYFVLFRQARPRCLRRLQFLPASISSLSQVFLPCSVEIPPDILLPNDT